MAKPTMHSVRNLWIIREWDKCLVLLALIIFFVFSPNVQLLQRISSPGTLFAKPLPFVTPVPAPYPVNTTGVYPGPEVSAQGVVVYDVNSGVIMYGRNTEAPLFPASTTKIMTAVVALEHYGLDDVVTVQTVANSGQVMGLVPGEQITVENLLYGALIHSGNDAAWALAEHYPGGVEKFVEVMNEKAAELHLSHTHFTNPVGYDDPAHTMSPEDLTRLAAYALNNHTIAKIVAIPQITISDTLHTRFHALTNVNALLGKIPGVAGIKTGWTEEAGENLVTLVERNGHRVITVVLKSQDRFGDTETLINWVFANYRWDSVSS